MDNNVIVGCLLMVAGLLIVAAALITMTPNDKGDTMALILKMIADKKKKLKKERGEW